MTKPKLIEKLEDLATFLALGASNASKEQDKESRLAAFEEGRKVAYNIAFTKVNCIILEAKE